MKMDYEELKEKYIDKYKEAAWENVTLSTLTGGIVGGLFFMLIGSLIGIIIGFLVGYYNYKKKMETLKELLE